MTTEPTVPPDAPPPSSKTPMWISLAALGGLLVGVVGTLGVTTVVGAVTDAAEARSAETAAEAEADAQADRLADAVRKCGGGSGIDLADNDQTLIIDVQGEDDASGASYGLQQCILESLDVPASVDSHIGQTTSLDGRQTETWDGITIEWSYHPDRGSDMVITLD